MSAPPSRGATESSTGWFLPLREVSVVSSAHRSISTNPRNSMRR